MSKGKDRHVDVKVITYNCFKSGMSAEKVFSCCFDSDTSGVSLKRLKHLERVFISPGEHANLCEYINGTKTRGNVTKDFAVFDGIVDNLLKRFPLMPVSFTQTQVQPYMEPGEECSPRYQ